MRRSWTLSFALMTMLALPVCAAMAGEGNMKLFKVVSAKDETVIGISDGDLRRFGSGSDVEVLAQKLKDAGQLTVWQYATRKASDGALEQAPLRQVAIFPALTVRIEPYSTPLQIVAPK